MANKWKVTVSFPGQTDETTFDTEAEATAFANSAQQSPDDTTVAIIDPEGQSHVLRSGRLSASA